jgi:phosphoglucomutase
LIVLEFVSIILIKKNKFIRKNAMHVSPLAGALAPSSMLVNLPSLVSLYYTDKPDVSVYEEMVSFGTSGHRGSSFKRSFNEAHILAITQAICFYREGAGITGPLFLGMDTHALSVPAHSSALEVLAGNGVSVMISDGTKYTPTPVISHAILGYNKGKKSGLADGILITPSHNPPQDGGFKYNPPHGGPAGADVTNWIQNKANEILLHGLKEVKRISLAKALSASSTQPFEYRTPYISDLRNCIDMDAIRESGLQIGVDPLGGAGIHYWQMIKEEYGISLELVNEEIDETFRFMSLDGDGQIRMDPSSSHAMQGLLSLKDRFDISFACDTDYDRHGIVTKSSGLLPANHYLSSMISYLFQNRPEWGKGQKVGKTIVSSLMIDRVASKCLRDIYEVPVGFKWFVDGLLDSSLAFVGEESAGASFARKDGSVWSTDKDGIIACLLAAEMTAVTGKDPAQIYADLEEEFGSPVYGRIDAPATTAEKKVLKNLSPSQIKSSSLAGESIRNIQTKAEGNKTSIGGLKVVTENGWFAARPSGTEEIYKIYAESFLGQEHLDAIFEEAQAIVINVLS